MNQLESGTSSTVLTLARANVRLLARTEKRVLREVVQLAELGRAHTTGVLGLRIARDRIVAKEPRPVREPGLDDTTAEIATAARISRLRMSVCRLRLALSQ